MTVTEWEKLPMFDVKKAEAGASHIHLFDADKGRVYTGCMRIDGGHPALLIFSGEWMAHADGDDSYERFFRMAPQKEIQNDAA